jgi:hypothetical protein
MRTVLLLTLLVSAPATASAQAGHTTVPPATRDSVVAVAKRLFDGMRAHDGAMIASTFAQGAMMSGVPRPGRPVEFRSTEGFVAQAGNPGEPWDEQIYDPIVQVDGDLASLWVFYTFSLGTQFSHCGFDNFQMTRIDGEWKISFLADTRRQTGCETAGRVRVE